MNSVTIADIRAAAVRLAGQAVETPVLAVPPEAGLAARILLKAENLQRIGAFKFRGAYNALACLAPDVRARGVVAWSSGNHAQGVAAAARAFGVPAAIVMPHDAPAPKRARTQALGAEVVGYDRARESREEIAAAIAADRGLTPVPPYDHADVIAGQGTAGLELAAHLAARGETPHSVYVPCSGGGLTAGVGIALRASFPGVRIVAVEPAGFDDTARSLAFGRPVAHAGGASTLCDALMVPRPGEITFALNRALGIEAATVTDAQVLDAMRFAFDTLRLVLEPGGAAGLAAALAAAPAHKGETLCAILSGGNVDPALFARATGG